MITKLHHGNYYGEFILNNEETYSFLSNKSYQLVTATEVFDEDYKTAITQGNPSIPKNTEVVLESFFRNCYGEYFAVRYNGYLFYAKPSCFNYVKLIEK